METLTLEDAPARIRFKTHYRGAKTQNNYYTAGQVADYGPEANGALVLEGIAEPAPADAPIDEPAENAMGMALRRPQPPRPPAPPVRPPEPEPESYLTMLADRRRREIAQAEQDAAAQAERVAKLDAFLASDLPARFVVLEAEVATLKAKVQP